MRELIRLSVEHPLTPEKIKLTSRLFVTAGRIGRRPRIGMSPASPQAGIVSKAKDALPHRTTAHFPLSTANNQLYDTLSFVMDEKTLVMLEFPKILERLAGYTSFSASGELARALAPTTDLDDARLRLAQTSEARRLLSIDADVSVGGVHDVRPQVDLAEHGAMLEPTDLLAIKTTLIAARTIARTLDRLGPVPHHGRPGWTPAFPARGSRRHLALHLRARRDP